MWSKDGSRNGPDTKKDNDIVKYYLIRYNSWKHDTVNIEEKINNLGYKLRAYVPSGLPRSQPRNKSTLEEKTVEKLTLEEELRREIDRKKRITDAIDRGLENCDKIEREIIKKKYFWRQSRQSIEKSRKNHALDLRKVEVSAIKKIRDQLTPDIRL